MLKIEVNSEEVEIRSGTSSRTSKPYQIREQTVWVKFYDFNGNEHPYPARVRISLDDQQQPYKKGFYTIDPASFFPDRFGQMSIRLRLKPIAMQQTQPRAA